MTTVKNIRDEEVSLTDAEVNAIKDMIQMKDDGNEMIYIGDISGDPKKVRGVLSSLVKKNCIDVNREDGGLISCFVTL